MAVDDVRRAVKTFFAGNRRVVEGELVKIDDEVLKGREHLFEALHTGRHKPKPLGPRPAAPVPAPPAPAAATSAVTLPAPKGDGGGS